MTPYGTNDHQMVKEPQILHCIVPFSRVIFEYWYLASETLSGVHKFELVRYMCKYICMEVRVA